MRAVVLTDDARIVLADRPVPVPGPAEVLVKVRVAGICGTDLHAPSMSGMFADDVVLGHEFAGTVAGLGSDAGGIEIGRTVVVNPIALSCGDCEACRRDLGNHCLAALTRVTGVARDGGMAEFVTVEARAVHLVPDTLPVLAAVWTEPLAVALRALEHGRVRAGTTVAIVGAGAIGQLILQLALNAGAQDVLVVETSAHRRSVAVGCGATRAVGPDEPGGTGELWDVVFDCTGSSKAFPTSLGLVGYGGRVVVLGSYPTPPSLEGVAREATIVFSSVYRDGHEFAGALQLLARGLVDVRSLTTGVLPIGSFEAAFAALRQPDESVKIFLDPTGTVSA